MLELARDADRQAGNAMARQGHAMHVAWRPDLYEMVEEHYPEERFRQAVEEKQLYVAKINGTVVGYTLLLVREVSHPGTVKRRVMRIDEICVEESCRNQGIGQEMMADVRALARAFGCRDLQLGVYPQNDSAVAFYEKCGFTIRSIDMLMKV